MMLLLGVLVLVALLGYLAQTTGLCLVRGVKEWLSGNPAFLLAILLCGVWAWVASLSAYYFSTSLPFKVFEANSVFALGGLLFGLGTAFNQGCNISTLSKLSRGDLKMSATLLGWLIGWCVLARWRPEFEVVELPPPSVVTYGLLVVLSVAISIWGLQGNLQRKKIWFGMMGIGFLSGFLFVYELGWPPSGLLHDLSAALLHGEDRNLPAPHRYFMLLALVIGMALAAWRDKCFVLHLGKWSEWLLHLLAGTLMGLGASLAMGGNDAQLLLALPAFSPAGFVVVLCMLLGIVLGLKIKSQLTSR